MKKMMKLVVGTDETKELIENIVRNFQALKPNTLHVDYSVTVLKNKASLVTEENSGIMRNVSIIKIKGLHLAIGNKSGDLIIRKKPFLMSENKVLKKVTDFLMKIQPENLAKSKKIEKDVFSDYSIFEEKQAEFSKIKHTFYLGRERIQRVIGGSNVQGMDECVQDYKFL